MIKPTIEEITIIYKVDDSPDWSYLETEFEKLPHGKLKIISSAQIEQSFADKHPRIALKQIEANADRLRQINEGLIWAIGIYAKATVRTREGSYSLLDHLQSGGLWGIESDSGRGYFEEVEKEQLADLKEHLEAFNVDVSNFEELAKKAERKDVY